jgi:hypothetical protein
MSTTESYTFAASGFPRLVEFERLIGEKDERGTMIQYRIIGTGYKLRFFRYTSAMDNENRVSLWLTNDFGEKIDTKIIKVPQIIGTRSAKAILEANGFTLIYSKSRVNELLAF